MTLTLLKSKIHRATVTEADLNYEGSISICPTLIEAAGFVLHEQVDIYNCNNGARFHTYVIKGQLGQICLNGAAARHVHKGDLVIIAAYAGMSQDEAKKYHPTCVFVNEKNEIKEIRDERSPHL
ncbi:MAG: aspartate 1-decarboxylase [Bdellovibrio sp. CG10_big_fil_rev_8_21_14_0_10_47_8]|nr:MAG: aspartate 1-decarboxylase [Bdellovibrio sp. CG10_big_fil_rev_8_21_14_0_10_47_8]